jgi:hypothetical protein
MTPTFSSVEYIHGHEPQYVSGCGGSLAIKLPPSSSSPVVTGEEALSQQIINIPHEEEEVSPGSEESGWKRTVDLCKLHHLVDRDIVVVLNIKRMLLGFSQPVQHRINLVKLRLECFFILTHSRAQFGRFSDYISSGSLFLKELLEFANISSEICSVSQIVGSSSPKSAEEIELSHAGLESVVALLENTIRRKNAVFLKSNIKTLLSLTDARSSGSAHLHDDVWTTIIVAACANASSVLFSSDVLLATKVISPSDVSVAATTAANEGDSSASFYRGGDGEYRVETMYSAESRRTMKTHINDRDIYDLSKLTKQGKDGVEVAELTPPAGPVLSEAQLVAHCSFLRLSLELFALCIKFREPMHLGNDLPLIHTIVGLLSSCIPLVEKALQNFSTIKKYRPTVAEHQIVLVASKAIFVLELVLHKAGYVQAFRESEALPVILRIMEAFAGTGVKYREKNAQFGFPEFDSSTRTLADDCVSALLVSIQKSRQSVFAGPLNTAESIGLRAISQPYFATFTNKAFLSPFSSTGDLWSTLLKLLREVVNADPASLSAFLTSSFGPSLRLAFAHGGNAGGGIPPVFSEPGAQLADILLPLIQFAHSTCITAQGKEYLEKSKIVQFVISALVHPAVLQPASSGLGSDTLAKISKVLAQIMAEHDSTRHSARLLLKEKLTSIAQECQTTAVGDGTSFSPNVDEHEAAPMDLQKLTNICTLVLNVFGESRRHDGETMGYVLQAAVIKDLLETYPATLPSSRKLFSQLAVRNSINWLGNSALNALLRVAGMNFPQLILPALFFEINKHMNNINICRRVLREKMAVDGNAFGVQAVDDQLMEDLLNRFESSSGAADDSAKGGLIFKSNRFENLSTLSGENSDRKSKGSEGIVNRADITVNGLLNLVPHVCVIDPEFQSRLYETSISSNKKGSSSTPLWHKDLKNPAVLHSLDQCVRQLLVSLLSLEWLCLHWTNAMRVQRHQTSVNSLINGSRDTIRRVFVFHRSSILEIASLGISKWSSKVCFFLRTECPSTAGDVDTILLVLGEIVRVQLLILFSR